MRRAADASHQSNLPHDCRGYVCFCEFASVPVGQSGNERRIGFPVLTNDDSTFQAQAFSGLLSKATSSPSFTSEAAMFARCHIFSLSVAPSLSRSPLVSARFTSSSLNVCLQPNSQMIIHLAALDSSRQAQGLRSSAKGQINTPFLPLLFLLLSSLHFPSLSWAITLSVMFTLTRMLVNYKSPGPRAFY